MAKEDNYPIVQDLFVTEEMKDDIDALVKSKNVPEKVKDLGINLQDLHQSQSKYSPQQKLAAAMAYVVTGSVNRAAKLVPSVPKESIYWWKNNAPWWDQAIQYARKIQADEFDGITTGIMRGLLSHIEERLHLGDEAIDKNGKIRHRKISARDAVTVYGILHDKRALGRGDATARTVTSAEDTLVRLEERFRNFARSFEEKKINDDSVVATQHKQEDE